METPLQIIKKGLGRYKNLSSGEIWSVEYDNDHFIYGYEGQLKLITSDKDKILRNLNTVQSSNWEKLDQPDINSPVVIESKLVKWLQNKLDK